MKQVDFYSLPRAIQDRLVSAFRAEFDPKPIAAHGQTRGAPWIWFAVAAASLAALVVVYRLGYGRIESALARHPLPVAAAYVLLAAAIGWTVCRAIGHLRDLRGLPFPPGVYLFPANLIDARDRRLRVFPLERLTRVAADGGAAIAVEIGADRFSFPVDQAKRDSVVEQVRSASERMKGKLDEGQRRELDPLVRPALVSPLASDVPLTARGARWHKARWAVAGVVGLLGVPVYLVRDRGSDAQMFAEAHAKDDVASYRRYLARGGAEQARVSRELLPRAALREAVAKKSVEAIRQFSKEYPNTAIEDEVASALRAALEVALAEAESEGTLSALMAFEERYPDHGLDEPLKKARHSLYARAAERYRSRMPAQNKAVGKFVERMLAAAESIGSKKTPEGVRGPTAEVRMRRLPSRGFGDADELVGRNPGYLGPLTLPSRFVDAPYVEPHEKKLAEAIAGLLGECFDADLITFAPGAPLEGKGEELPVVKTPTLVVNYRVEPSGSNYANRKPRCVIVGLSLIMQSTFLLPDGGEPLRLAHTVKAGVPIARIAEHKGPPAPGVLEKIVYEDMLATLFDLAHEHYRRTWLRDAK